MKIGIKNILPSTDENALLLAIRTGLFIINYLIILLIPIVIIVTTREVTKDYKAYELIKTLSSIPTPPWNLLLYTQLLIIFVILTSLFRHKYPQLPAGAQRFFALLDITAALFIVYLLSIADKGILLLIITNSILYVSSKRDKYILVTVCLMLFIVLDYDLLATGLNLYSINNYIGFYSSSTRAVLYGIRSILLSLNLVLFLLFMIFEIQKYLEETTRIKELNKALFDSTESLKITNIQLEEYSIRNQEMARLKERNRLAREIHDTIGHYLTAMDLGIKACMQALKKDPELLDSHLQKVNSLTQKSLLDVRHSINELKPDALSRYSLLSAIEQLSKEISSFSRVKLSFFHKGNQFQIKSNIEELIYRAVQESITNALKHGHPRIINISLEFYSKGIGLEIKNDGVKKTEFQPGFGLKHIGNMVSELNGQTDFFLDDENYFNFKIKIPQARRSG